MITRCKNGHWYDSGVNRACPHCKQESEKLSIRLNDIEEDDRTVSIIETDLSLGEELGAIIGNSIEHTMSVSQGNSFDDDDKTISFGFFGMTAIKPVAGWLVCMNGSEKGKKKHNFVYKLVKYNCVIIANTVNYTKKFFISCFVLVLN